MTFNYSFKPQFKSAQKVDSSSAQEFNADKVSQIEYAKELDDRQIAERAMDDLTGASYVSDEEGMSKKEMNALAIDTVKEMTESLEPMREGSPVKQESLDKFVGGNDYSKQGMFDNPNPFDDTTGDPPGLPRNPKRGATQQRGSTVNTSNSDGINDPTTPEGGCEGDFDFWRPNPEEYKDYGSMSLVNSKELVGNNEMNLVLDTMSVDTMGM